MCPAKFTPLSIHTRPGSVGAYLSPATVEKLRVTMNRMFELAIEWNMAGASPNPVRSVKPNLNSPDGTNVEPDFLSV